jgi:DNA-binding MurR/RpiR family transcriptional regulator
MLGYRGFPEFQEVIRHRYLASLDAVAIMREHAAERHGDAVLASLDQDIRNLSATRSVLDREAVRQVARSILDARSVVIVGAGSHGGLGLIFAHLCRFMGLPVDAEIRGGVTLATRLASIGPGDVVIGTGAWWVVQLTREALAVARERGATTVAIVDNRASALAQVADHVLITRTETVSFFQSMTGPLAVLNAVVAEIAASGEERVRDAMETTGRMFERLGVAWHGEGTPLEIAENWTDGGEERGVARPPSNGRRTGGKEANRKRSQTRRAGLPPT